MTTDVPPQQDMMLSAAEVAAMHDAFLARTAAFAARLVRRAQGDDSLTPAVTAYLHRAARNGIAVDEEQAVAMIARGGDAIETATQALVAQPLFTPAQQEKIDAAAQHQHIYPQVAQVFGEQTRLYLRCADSPAGNIVRTRVEAHLHRHGYHITDYARGHATDTTAKQQFRIGKLLKTHAPGLYDAFVTDTARSAGKLRVVICRGSNDIARMSTGRGWLSCMQAGKAEFNAFVPRDIAHGTLVAYLVSERDPDIANPLARLLIKPYVSADKAQRSIPQDEYESSLHAPQATPRAGLPPRGRLGRLFSALGLRQSAPAPAATGTAPDPDVAFVPEGRTYGLDSPLLQATVAAFVSQYLNHGPDGGYVLSPLLYCDRNSSREIVKRGDKLHIMGGFANNVPL